MMFRKQADLMIVLALVVAVGAATFADVHAVAILAPLAVLLIAVLPGYAITRATRLRGAGFPAHLLLVLGMSVAITGLCGFVLNWMPGGLQARSWVVLLGGITTIATLIALFRNTRASGRALLRHAPVGPRPARTWRARHTVLIAMALCVVVAAATVSYVGATHQPRNGFTQLWMVPQQSAGPNALRIGISSEELTATNFRLDLSIAGQVVQEWSVPTLKPHDQWQTIVVLPNGTGSVEAALYRANEPDQVYRYTALVR